MFDNELFRQTALIVFLGIVVDFFVFRYLNRKNRTDEENELFAVRLIHYGTLLSMLSISSAGGVLIGGARPLVVVFGLGIPIAIHMLSTGHSIQVAILKTKIRNAKQAIESKKEADDVSTNWKRMVSLTVKSLHIQKIKALLLRRQLMREPSKKPCDKHTTHNPSLASELSSSEGTCERQ